MLSLGKIAFLTLVLFNLYATSFYVLHGELDFHSDIARDFLLLNEIEERKIVLIGGSTSIAGVFHGPFWSYLNFPAYYLTKGDPIAVGAFRLLLVVFFTALNFVIAQKLFGKMTAYFFTIIISSFLIPWGKAFNHPQLALLFMPAFFYTFWRYINSFKPKFLYLHILIAGIIIQLEIASGAPLFLLSTLFISYLVIKKRKFAHFLAFLLILIPLSSHIIFELRHNFFQLKSVLKYIGATGQETYAPFADILKDRAMFISAIGQLIPSHRIGNILTTLLSLFFILRIVQKGKNRYIYLIFLYFLLGYFSLTLLTRHHLLVHQFLPLVPIAMMTFLSLAQTKYAKFVLPLILIVIIVNEISAVKSIKAAKTIIDSGSSETSWRAVSQLSGDVFKNQEREFGYFVYSPDKLAYVGKYAMVYAQKRHNEKTAHYFKKAPVTYVISAPAALNDPWAKYFTDQFWITNSIKITKQTTSEKRYANGYTVKRYELTAGEMAVPFDQHEDTGIHFR